jgi:glucose/arabinose dehydrogenase
MARRSYVLAALGIVLAFTSVFGADGNLPSVRPRTTLAAPLAGPMAAPDNSITLQPFLSGLSAPVLITHAGDGSGRLFVVEKAGVIKIVVGGQVRSTPFLDLTSIVQGPSNTEQGLLGLAFHPQYETNGRFFVFYTAKPPPQPTTNVGSNTLAEYHVSEGDPEIANPVPVRTLLSIPDRATNHNGGMIAFSPVDSNSYLYIGTGDEGTGGANAQDPLSLYGKILRIDVDTPGTPAPPGSGYSVPSTNPFVGNAAYRPEIWALGFRNPWRWSFDRQTGDMFIGDVGQQAWEEIDRIPSLLVGQNGRNFGWSIREGAHCRPPATSCATSGLTDPILEYDHGLGCSVTGGYRYRGSANPALQGIYFYGDFCAGRIWKGIASGAFWGAIEAIDTPHNISSFGEDELGELFVVTLGGSVFRLVQAAPPAANCSSRPRVTVQSTRTSPGTLDVTLTATDSPTVTNNELQSIAFNHIVNGFVTIGTQVDQQSPFTVTLPAGSRSARFTAERNQGGQPLHVDFSVTDRCGPWQTFVGGGATMP